VISPRPHVRAVSREAIVATALELMVEQGLSAVTLRRIAEKLNVSAPTLYWYIANKRELLDSLAEHLLRRGRTGVFDRPHHGQPWWEWLEERGRAMFEAMVAVRDAPQVVAGNRPTVDMLASNEIALGELVAVGFGATEAQQVFFVLGGYVGGMALECQAEQGRADAGLDDGALLATVQESGRFPHLTAVAPEQHAQSTFDYGLSLLIRGIRARHRELTGG
jgi:TetR/AcrR family transcriptional regulator, tetracycline repressor protein